MSELIDTTEMYLRTIFELIEEGIPPLRARIVERLEQSGPTVSQTVARMERDGLLHVTPERQIELTDEGYRKAASVMRKHRLAERFLVDVLDVDLSLVHDEACRWEHVISDEVAAKLAEKVANTEESPYGNPIPALSVRPPEAVHTRYRAESRSLSECDRNVRYKLLRMSEWVQAHESVLADLTNLGVRPGVELMWHVGDLVQVGDGPAKPLSAEISGGLYVVPA